MVRRAGGQQAGGRETNQARRTMRTRRGVKWRSQIKNEGRKTRARRRNSKRIRISMHSGVVDKNIGQGMCK